MVPTRYGRQAILDEFEGLKRYKISALMDSNRVVDAKFTVSSLLKLIDVLRIKQVRHVILKRFIIHSRFCYMVKPHEQLVLVSSTRHRASTPNLSTS